MGAGTTAALVSVATSLINNPKLDEAALRQITVTAGVAFASVAAAELIVGALSNVAITTGTVCTTLGAATSSAISSGLASTFGASAGGAIFTGLSAAVVPVVGAMIGVLISQGIGVVYKGVKLYDGQYMSAEELKNATFMMKDVDGKKVMYVADKNGVAIGPWWNNPADILLGGIGGDILKATDGRDTQLLGKEGSDYIEGKSGNDMLDGGLGNDFLVGADGDDVLDGGNQDDVLIGESGKDVLIGGSGQDVLNGDSGNDVLDGELGNDFLDGGLGDDALNGGEGNDELIGGLGNDLLYAGAGKDTLIGGEGSDVLAGGYGAVNTVIISEATFKQNFSHFEANDNYCLRKKVV